MDKKGLAAEPWPGLNDPRERTVSLDELLARQLETGWAITFQAWVDRPENEQRAAIIASLSGIRESLLRLERRVR